MKRNHEETHRMQAHNAISVGALSVLRRGDRVADVEGEAVLYSPNGRFFCGEDGGVVCAESAAAADSAASRLPESTGDDAMMKAAAERPQR